MLHIIPSLSGGGTERQLGALAPQLARMGHAVHVAYLNQGPSPPKMPAVELHRLESFSNYDPLLLWRLFRIVRRIKPDIIQTWIVQMDIVGGFLARVLGIPWVLREPSSAMGYGANGKTYLRLFLGAGAQALVANSSGGNEYWSKRIPRARRYTIKNGIPFAEISGDLVGTSPIISENMRPLVFSAGRLAADRSGSKNVRTLIEALAVVKQRLRVRTIICGEGPQRTDLEDLRDELGLQGDVEFWGHQPASTIWGLMKAASIYISLSAYEGCPNAVLEAMACGCPLVVSDIPAHRELLDEHSALFVDPSDIQQAADAVVRAIADEKASKRRGDAARARAGELSVEKMAACYERVYRQLLEDGADL
jgi:glycosyltransferase involved in cell wall biosynthesis